MNWLISVGVSFLVLIVMLAALVVLRSYGIDPVNGIAGFFTRPAAPQAGV